MTALVPQSQFRAVKPYFTGSAYIVSTVLVRVPKYMENSRKKYNKARKSALKAYISQIYYPSKGLI
jgi:hypothetical protein